MSMHAHSADVSEYSDVTVHPDADQTTRPGKRVKELLSPKSKQLRHSDSDTSRRATLRGRAIGGPRDALGAYIAIPESYPSSVVVYYNDEFVAIHDLYPKSTLHLLLLPRDPLKVRLHPFDAFEDPQFLAKVKAETTKLRSFAAAELRRRYGRDSEQDRLRQEAINVEPPLENLPPGRNWESELICGIHARPSMNHLHIHVLSVDRYGDRLKHRKHYNSFSTPFFIDIEDFPLGADDPRRHPEKGGYLRQSFKCWRCGEDFGNSFSALKSHLEKEFHEWKRL